MVDTQTRGRTTVYRIMQEGENYLQRAGSEDAQGETAKPAPSRRRRRTTNRRVKAKSGEATETSATDNEDAKSTPRRTSRRRGPKTELGELIDEGYFGTARTMTDAQDQLRHKKGLRFTLQDLSPSFVRLLREGRLDRERNAAGQYEYTAK